MRLTLPLLLVLFACGDNAAAPRETPDPCCTLLPDRPSALECVAQENADACQDVTACPLPGDQLFIVLGHCQGSAR